VNANLLTDAIGWLFDPANQVGEGGIPIRVFEHVRISALSVGFALVPALGAGLAIGHLRRGEFLTVTAANVGRAIPSLAILGFAFYFVLDLTGRLGDWPTVITCAVLAVPPILTNAHVGIREVDPDLVEASRGMGMSGLQVLRIVEIPLAAPLILAGIRTSAVQVVATATLGAIVAGGGLGRYIVDGFAQNDYEMVLGGAILVALLAIVTELFFSAVEKLASPARARRPTSFAPAYQEVAQVGRDDVSG